MEEEYVAKQSTFYQFSFLLCLILLVLFVLPGVIYILVKVLKANHHTITFYKGKYIIKTGIIHTNETEVVFKGVLSASVQQGAKGKIFNFGDVRADIAGSKKLYLTGVKNPNGLKNYLNSKQIDAETIDHTLVN